jgi:glycerophosphoryl diester phosphodiesterase
VPTLSEVLALLRDRARAMIEIKSESVTNDEEGGIEAMAIADVRRLGMEKDVALISFDRRALVRCRKIAPEIARGHVFERGKPGDFLTGAREAGCEVVMPHKSLLSEELRDRAREAGIKVATWVVDEPAELPRLSRFDLFGIGSNRPGVLMEALREEG